jgi:threonine dehydrogenase-like Zn-dependent dehydrogenase
MKAVFANTARGRDALSRVKAMVFRKSDKSYALPLELLDAPEPSLIGPEWVKVRTIVSGISDLDEGVLLHPDTSPLSSFLSFPFVPGNENVGIITEVGADAPGVELGERVVVNPLLSCKPRGISPLCPSCSRGEHSACANFADGPPGSGTLIGACRDVGGGWGDSFVAHSSQVRTLPQNLDTDQAVLIPEFTRALRTVLQHPPQPGDRVVIVGAGSLGMLTLEAMKMLRLIPDVLVVAERSFEADAVRRSSSAEVVVSAGDELAYDGVAEFTKGTARYSQAGRMTLKGGADLVYETTGEKRNVEDAIQFAGEGKTVALSGLKRTAGFDLTPLWLKNVKIYGTAFSGRESYEQEQWETFDIALHLVAERGLPFSEIVTHKFKLDEYQRALDCLADRSRSKMIKAIFQHVV